MDQTLVKVKPSNLMAVAVVLEGVALRGEMLIGLGHDHTHTHLGLSGCQNLDFTKSFIEW